MIKKIQIELTILALLIINIFLSYNIDVGLYNYFSNLNFGFEAVNLKEFFVGITELGDSFWYFLIIPCIFLISLVCEKIKLISNGKYDKIKNFSIFSFLYLLVVGLITQILKHLIGRPRPNHTDFSESFGFNFFTTDSAFHSFPSGHSSTIVSVVLIASLAIPSLRIFFYFFGFLIAISRVVVGAHFVTDVIAGAIVSLIVYKIFLSFAEKRFPNISFKSYENKDSAMIMKTFVIFSIIAIFITVGSKFDIFFSELFYYGNSQFLLQSYDLISIIFRRFLLPFLVMYIFILPIVGIIFPIHKVFFDFRFSFKDIVFIWASGIITLVLVVNVLLKNAWGRVRPNDILQFGGEDIFTPWYKLGDSCVSNCSFVSGDASVGFMLIIFYFITKKIIFFYLAISFGLALGFIRIIAGGHFFSDIIFSQIVVTTTVTASYILYKKLYDK